VGWAKTGTTTLGYCLRHLGYRHRSKQFGLVERWMKGDLDGVLARADRYDSFDDWPWLLLYPELDRRFRGTRFILTTRAPDAWLRSYRNMVSRQRRSRRLDRIRSFLYGLPFPDVSDEDLVARFRRHEREVREYFAGRESELLVVNWGAGHGWEEICGFLGRSIPDLPFPHRNRGKYALPDARA